MKTKVLFVIGILFILSSCIKEDLDPCPLSKVKVNVYAEKFQNPSENAMDNVEGNIKDRIGHLRYYLYQGGKMKKKGIVSDWAAVNGAFYTLTWEGLDWGDYQLVLVCNSTKNALSGDDNFVDNLLLTYPGCDLTEDYFATVFSFTVDCDCELEFNTALSRVQSIVRYTFKNVPSDLTDIEVEMSRLTARKYITGDYEGEGNAIKKYTIIPARAESVPGFVIGTFPTLTDTRALLNMRFYRNHEVGPYYEKLVTDTLRVKRNQLLDIVTTFSDGKIDFEIRLDGSWDGFTPGGDTEIE